MENSTANPLAKHFRQPAIFLKLPSNGRYYPEGSLDLNLTGEIPVYPMTVKDELLLKTPDALMNGTSTSEMIRSCCPNIKDPWAIPLVDLDAILIAVRLASYGQGMDINSKCTHCGASNEHTIDLRNLLDSLPPMSTAKNVAELNDLILEFHPQTFAELNKAGLIEFEQQKIINTVADSDLEQEEKVKLFTEGFKRLTELNIESLVSCISSIRTGDYVVTNRDQIKEFLVNTDRQTFDDIHQMVKEFVGTNAVPPVEVACPECKETYKVGLEFNQTNFFG